MKKSSFISILLILNLFIISCTSGLNNLGQGRLSVYVGNNGRYQADEKTALPTDFTLKIIRDDSTVKELDFPASTGITVENLIPGEYELIVSGSTTYFYFEGKSKVKVLPSKDSIANIQLVKFRRPLYVKDGAEPDGKGTVEKPFATITEAETYIEDGANAAFYIDGTFDYANTKSSIKQLYLQKAPDAAKAEIKPANKTFYINSTNDFTDITFIDTKISIANDGILSIGGSTRLTVTPDNITYFDLKNKKPIVISSPLTSQKVGAISLSDETIGSQILLAGNDTVNIADECKKFDFTYDALTKNRYYIDSNGKLAENKPIKLTLENTKGGTKYTCKVKYNGSDIASYEYSTPGEIKDGSATYYFEFGKTYTVEVYEGASAGTLIRSQDITIGNENNVSFDVNTYFVSASGDDSKDGSSKATAFRNLSTAISRIGNSKGNIMVIGTIDVPTMISIGSGTQLNINGTDNATVNCTSDFMNIETGASGGSITIQNLKINGNIKLGSGSQRGTLILKSGTVIPETYNITAMNPNSSLTIEDSAQAGNVIIDNNSIKIKAPAKLISTTAATVTVNNPNYDISIIETADSTNFNKFKFKFSDTNALKFGYNSTTGKICGADVTELKSVLKKQSGTVEICPEITNATNDFPKLKEALNSSNANVKLSLRFTSSKASDQYLPDNCFSGCIKLTSADVQNITSMGNNAFSECTNLATITMPVANFTSVGGNAFLNCNKITSITLPDTLTQIGTDAFKGTGITQLVIPTTVTTVDNLATTNITKLTAPGNLSFAGNTILTDVMINASTSTEVTEKTTIAVGAYNGCTGINKVRMSGITTIGESCFENCGTITDIILPREPGNTVTRVEKNAFKGCTFGDQSIPQPPSVMPDPNKAEVNANNSGFQRDSPPEGMVGDSSGIDLFTREPEYAYTRSEA